MANGILSKGSFELLSLIQSHPEEAYGAGLHAQIVAATGKETSLGSIYTVLDRLLDDGMVSRKWGEPTPERGGRRKRFYVISAKGQRALADTESAYRLPSARRTESPGEVIPEGALGVGGA